jgi:hypothetical protein
MAAPTLTTRLDAANLVLRCMNEASVSSLTPPISEDTQRAIDTLQETTMEVLTPGWSVNTESGIELTLTGGKYAVSSDTISIELDRWRSDVDLVFRNDGSTLRLYNRAPGHATFTLPAGLKATIIKSRDFEELPEAFRRYIAIRAARTTQSRIEGAGAAIYSERDELIARKQLRQFEVHMTRPNALSNVDVDRFRGRRSYPWTWRA